MIGWSNQTFITTYPTQCQTLLSSFTTQTTKRQRWSGEFLKGGFQILFPLPVGKKLLTQDSWWNNCEVFRCYVHHRDLVYKHSAFKSLPALHGTHFSVILHTKSPYAADLCFLLLLVRDSLPSASQSQSLLLINIISLFTWMLNCYED